MYPRTAQPYCLCPMDAKSAMPLIKTSARKPPPSGVRRKRGAAERTAFADLLVAAIFGFLLPKTSIYGTLVLVGDRPHRAKAQFRRLPVDPVSARYKLSFAGSGGKPSAR